MNWDSLNRELASYQIGAIRIESVIGLMILAAILLGAFYILKRYVIPFLGSRGAVRKRKKLLYRIEVASWTVYTIVGLYQLLTESFYITLVILLVLILAGRNFWMDFFGGIIFRLEDKFKLRDPVKFNEFVGTIESIERRNIRLKTDKEELVTIPFRKLNNSVFIKRQAKGKLHSAQVNLHLGAKSPDEVIPHIKKWLFECPWSVSSERAKVKVIGGGLIQLTIYAIDEPSIQRTEDFIQNKIRK